MATVEIWVDTARRAHILKHDQRVRGAMYRVEIGPGDGSYPQSTEAWTWADACAKLTRWGPAGVDAPPAEEPPMPEVAPPNPFRPASP
jgi:hypothetical protein